MSSKTEDLYKNKIRLVYEYNRNSPLFVRIANWELESNNHKAAIEILEKGLRDNPDFPTPYFILGKAYSKLNEFGKALKCFKKGSDLIHSKETYLYYSRELNSLRNLKTPPELRSYDMPDEKKEKSQEEIPKQVTSQDFHSKEESSKSTSIEDNLDKLADKISQAKIPVISENNPAKQYGSETPQETMIVSETLAKIYLAQGEIQEAITVYEKLCKKYPAKENYFSQKISELKSKLQKS